MEVLYLENNTLVGSIPAELGNLTNLKKLYLGNHDRLDPTNRLSGSIPAELGNLVLLEILNLEYNNLTGQIPPELGNLTNLTFLYSSGNSLTGPIPAEIGNLTELRVLDLRYNNLTGSIPAEIGNLAKLGSLRLRGNYLTGSIPKELGRLASLRELNLWSNNLRSSIPKEIWSLPHLENLYLSGNRLTGQIPADIGNLTGLTGLGLGRNNFTGPIPEELWKLTRLGWLSLNDNDFTGSIPAEIENLTRLDALYLNNNNFAGPIPVEIGNLKYMRYLDLNRNLLTGSIPSEIANMANLERLYLHHNYLTGCIPENVAQLREQLGFHYRPNPQRRGYLPVCSHRAVPSVALLELDEDSEVTYEVALSADPLADVTVEITVAEGAVTVQPTSLLFTAQSWSTPQTVTVRATWDDDFEDESAILEHHVKDLKPVVLPVSIRDVSHITCTNSSPAVGGDARLVGNCTALLRAREALESSSSLLNWSINQPIADWDGIGTTDGKVTTLDINNRELTGSIPVKLADLLDLTRLDLSHNTLTDSIPIELSGLTNLTWLNLGYNDLGGEIPTELGGLANLTGLILNDNRLTGAIPATLGNLTLLETMHLHSNNITGCIPANVAQLGRQIGPGYVLNPQERGNLPNCGIAVLSLSLLELDENTEATYEVVLSADPFADMMVEIKVTGEEDAVTVHPTSLLFTVQNWNTPQTVTVRAVVDDDRDDDLVTLEHHVPDIDPILLPVKVVDVTVISNEASTVPQTFALWGNYPNPFNSSTRIEFDLPEPAMIHLEITDLLGRRVQTLPARFIGAGTHKTIVLDASDLSSSTYLYRLVAVYDGGEEHVQHGRMLLIK